MVNNSDTPCCVDCENRWENFNNLSEEELKIVCENRHIAEFQPGEIIFKQGAPISSAVFLTKGMKGIWTEKNNKITAYTENDINYLAWKTHELHFKNTPLTEVCQTIGNSYNLQFNLDASTAENYLFTGNFNNVKVNQMLDIIASTLDIKFIKTEDHVQVNFK